MRVSVIIPTRNEAQAWRDVLGDLPAGSASLPSTATVRICRLRFLGARSRRSQGTTRLFDRHMMAAIISLGAKTAHPALFDGGGMGTKNALEAMLARASGLQLSQLRTGTGDL